MYNNKNINNTFLSNENISMLWDVITDEDIFKYICKEDKRNQSIIYQIFKENLKTFYNIEIRNNTSLIDMNKKYILATLNIIKQMINNKPNRIKIHEEIPSNIQNNLITFEEIQNEKISQFEKDLNRHKEEFTNYMSKNIPPVPEFKDDYENVPITEMERLIKEITAQRNYDVERIKNTIHKDIPSGNNNNNKSPNNILENNLKEININNGTINADHKNVSWGNDEIINYTQEDINIEDKLFGKLKKVNINEKVNINKNKEYKQNELNIPNIIERINIMSEELNQLRLLLNKYSDKS